MTPDAEFFARVEPLRGALRVHCYRMLGSSHDGDDVVQETFLRAWRARASLDDPARLRPWLYRIATNACLDELKRRPRRVLSSDAYAPTSDPGGPNAPPLDEAHWLEPMPDAWIEAAVAGTGGGAADPGARYTLKESVALAFVAALQVLTPAQRAALLLRDVVGLAADEAAAALDMSVGAANSALHRARIAIDEKVGGRDAASFAPSLGAVDEQVLARYVRALGDVDLDALVALLHDDIVTAMPPSPTWVAGRTDNATFYRKVIGRYPRIAMVRTGANARPAFAFYSATAAGAPLALRAIQVLEVRDGALARVDHFAQPLVFPLFGLASELAA